MNIGIFTYIPVVLCLFFVAGLVLYKNSVSRTNRYFAFSVFSLASWLGFLFLSDQLQDPSLSLWSMRAGSLFGTLSMPFFVFFCIDFPTRSKRFGRKFKLSIIIPAVLFGILSFTPWLIPSVEFSEGSAQLEEITGLYSLQSVFLIGGYILAMVILIYKYFKIADARQKNQIAFVLGGIGIAIAVNSLTNYIFILLNLNSSASNSLGSISFLIFIGMTAYAIRKHGLFDIRAAIVRAIGFGLSVLVATSLFSLLILGIAVAFLPGSQGTIDLSSLEVLYLLPPILLIALTFHRLEHFVAKATRRIFFQDSYDLRDTLDNLSDALLTDNDIDKLMVQSMRIINGALRPGHAYFVVLDPDGKTYKDLLMGIDKTPDIEAYLTEMKGQSNALVNRDELVVASIARKMEQEDVTLILRLGAKQQPIGMLFFGPKRDGRIYSQQDIGLLRISAKNLGIAIDNAKRYEQISRFAETLKEEVQRATARLRKANEKLKTMDAMKDDFMSMASHQLRSPATSVHEALRMLNHPAFSEKERESLVASAEASSERLVTVVKTMLNMARLQAGRFTIDKTDANLIEMAESVLSQTKILADEKSIKIIFTRKPEKIEMSVDVAKIKEAMANYVENAIKYSPKNSTVRVLLEKQKDKISFEVSDEGMGVPEDDRKNLFGKFYRAANARTEEPDGNGIGLYVVKSIAQGHGGNSYYKPLKQGSLFGFWLRT